MGSHKLPDFLLSGSGGLLDGMSSKLTVNWLIGFKQALQKLGSKRSRYRPVGRFYCLHGLGFPYIYEARDPDALLSLFPTTTIDLTYALAHDHHIDSAIAAIHEALKQR